MNDSLIKKDIIKNFHKYKIPLLIYGSPGCGKSYLAMELLKNTILLRIDTNSLKEKNIKTYILDRLKKRNISLMFHKKIEDRGLLIDDIHIYYKYDKLSYKSIIEFIRENKFYESKIILTCCGTFLKNKDLLRLKIPRYEIKYTKSEYYKITNKIINKIIKDKNIKLSEDKYNNLIYYSNYNLNIFKSELNSLSNNYQEILIKNKDNFDPINIITNNLLKKKYSFNEIIRICGNDEIIIGFNLLENCLLFINDFEKSLYNIYKYYIFSDNMQTFIIKNHDNLTNNYSIGINICVINYYIHKFYKEDNNNPIIYNKYISRSMANINSLNFYNNTDFRYYSQ